MRERYPDWFATGSCLPLLNSSRRFFRVDRCLDSGSNPVKGGKCNTPNIDL